MPSMETMFPGLGDSMREAAQDFREWTDNHVWTLLTAIGEQTEEIKGLRADLAAERERKGQNKMPGDKVLAGVNDDEPKEPCADC